MLTGLFAFGAIASAQSAPNSTQVQGSPKLQSFSPPVFHGNAKEYGMWLYNQRWYRNGNRKTKRKN